MIWNWKTAKKLILYNNGSPESLFLKMTVKKGVALEPDNRMFMLY